jgi:molecular chaperone DnaK
MSKVIGIDLGTTNSVLAVFDGGEPTIIPNALGDRTTPSVVGFGAKGEVLVGNAARNQQITNPANTIYSVKRFMGRRHEEVQREEKIVPYRIVGKQDEFVKIVAGKKSYTPQEISAMILRELKQTAEAYLGEPVNRAVITVPAYFNDSQRQATKDAGAIAGLKVERIINEPTAAALAYGLEKRDNKRIVVVDFGGGTFDLSILEIGKGTFKVLGVHGDTHLGGDDFDQRIIDIVADDFRRRERIDLRDDPMALQRLKEAAVTAKVDLSIRLETTISLPFIVVDGNGPRHLQYTLERSTFESLCTDLFDEVREGCRVGLLESGVGSPSIGEVVLVGGSTRIPKVQQIAKQMYNTTELDKSINPDEVVALGAAILGGVLQGELKNVALMDVTSQSLGIETVHGGAMKLLSKNTPIPTTQKRIFSTPRDNQTSVHIRVLEGESSLVEENRSLGLFQLHGIPKAKGGVPQIEVAFDIDADGILKVSATDKATGRRQQIVIKGSIGLDKTELERMKKEAEMQEAVAQYQHGKVELRNHAEKVLHDMEKWLQYTGTMMPPRAKEQVVAALVRLQKKIKKDDMVGIKAALKRLDEVVTPLRPTG